MMYYFTMQFATPYMMIWKRTMQLLLSFLSYIKVTSTCLTPGFYGLRCIKCGRCAGNVDCGKLLGFCFGGCQPGFFGSKCKMTCSATCGGDGSCSQLTAFCENGCQSGFTGTQCDQIITSPESVTSPCLIRGFYGGLLNCIKCGRCAGNGDCHYITGECNGGCQPGFFGSKCKMTCSATCGGDGSCSQLTALCENGCQSGFTGTQCDQIITSPVSDAVHVWGPIAVMSLVVTIACIVILVLLYRRKNNKTESSYERNLVLNLEEETMSYVELNQLQENIRNNSTASYLNKNQAEKNCSAIKAQRGLANFESESQDYTVPKFTREEGFPDDQSQTEPKPTDSEPHPYIYVISS